MTEYLVCYDYGQGGVWLYLTATDKSVIEDKYPALTVLDAPPPWWTDELEAKARNKKESDPFWQEWLKGLPNRS
jgi:hypothetical protein